MTGTGRTVGIVGLGLVGGSLAQALVARGVTVVATTRSETTRRDAAEAGVTVVDAVDAVVHEADLVVLAVPLSSLDAHLAAVAAAPAPGEEPTTITDVGSVKGPVTASASRTLPEPSAFVPGHPMAGTEHVGWPAADPRLFAGRRWALALDAPVALGRWAEVADLAVSVGAEVVPVTVEAHDAAVALVSHLPYALAALAAARLDDDPGAGLAAGLAAGSFSDLTRVAGGHPTLGAEMATANAGALGPRLVRMADDLRDLAARLQDGDPVEEVFAAGGRGRHRLDAARGEPLHPVEVVLDRDALVALGRRGGRVLGVAPAAPSAETLTVTIHDPEGHR